jgi:hypothetical protein
MAGGARVVPNSCPVCDAGILETDGAVGVPVDQASVRLLDYKTAASILGLGQPGSRAWAGDVEAVVGPRIDRNVDILPSLLPLLNQRATRRHRCPVIVGTVKNPDGPVTDLTTVEKGVVTQSPVKPRRSGRGYKGVVA